MTPKMKKAISCLLQYPTHKQAAEAAGIAPRTLRDYLADPEFQEAYGRALDGLVKDATRQVQQAISLAVSTLREVMENNEERSSTKVAAARAVLEYALRYTEVTDIITRLEKLEGEVNTK